MKHYFRAAAVLGAAFFIAFAATANASPAITINAGKLLTGPGTVYSAVATLPAGAHINILACDKAGWCHVNRFNHTGWMPFANLDTHLYSHESLSPRLLGHPGQTASIASAATNGPALTYPPTSPGPVSVIKPGNGKTISTLGGNSSANVGDQGGGGVNMATIPDGGLGHQSTGMSFSRTSNRAMATGKAVFK